jgi:hypothetical protein
MNPLGIMFLCITSVALLLVPRRLAPVPLLAGACYMTLGQSIDFGPLSFSVLRILIAVGIARVLARREKFGSAFGSLDWLMSASAGLAVVTSGFHKEPATQLIFNLGFAYNTCGIYFLLRVFCRSIEDVLTVIQATAFLLVPVAVEMMYESSSRQNLFAVLGGVPELAAVREGRIRAQGPFAHAILAGTVGAVCLPMMIGLWRSRRGPSLAGIAACLIMVIASASTGPIASAFAGLVAMLMWRIRLHMALVRRLTVLGYAALVLVMKAPPYALIGRVDLAGGSAGWHRVALIDAAREHLNEWWLCGTDYTRHWMPTGVSWSPNHTDITNYYLHLGIIGGLPLTLVFVSSLVRAFSFVGKVIRSEVLAKDDHFVVWSLGAALLAHTATCISVSYFDQSFIYLYLSLAAIASAYASLVKVVTMQNSTLAGGQIAAQVSAVRKATMALCVRPADRAPVHRVRGGTSFAACCSVSAWRRVKR